MKMLSSEYWENRYRTKEIGWDIGYPSFPIAEYFDQVEDKSLKILIPGAGNAYEAEYLWDSGFDNVHVLDFSESALLNFKKRNPDFPDENLHLADFFQFEGSFDVIVEQTFFCALNPELRSDYVVKMKSLLADEGKLVGVMFNAPLNDDKPPFGGSALEYLGYFQPNFDKLYMKPCYNSIESRKGRELFIIMQ